MIRVCSIVKNLSLYASLDAIAFEYLSANSHAVTKSIQSVPNTATVCSFKLPALLNGTVFMIYGNSTLSGRLPGSGPHIVIILQPFFSLENLLSFFLLCRNLKTKRKRLLHRPCL